MKGRKFHQFFREQEQLNQFLGFPFSNLPYRLCWYPSAGFDFRHIPHFELNSVFTSSKPSVYLLTDAHISQYSPTDDFPFKPGRLIHQCESDGISLIVKDCIQVNFKQNLAFCPYQNEVFNNGLLHSNFNDCYSGNAFFILTELNAVVNYRKIKIQVPLFYFTYENLDFLMNFLLPNKIQVNSLINIRDGSGYGGSSYAMSFIYQFQRELKLQAIITDRNLTSDFIDFEKIEAQIMEYYSFQEQRNFFNRSNGYVLKQIFESFSVNRFPFKDWTLKSTSLPSNDLEVYNNNKDPLYCYLKNGHLNHFAKEL
jgi:hypothetical protein